MLHSKIILMMCLRIDDYGHLTPSRKPNREFFWVNSVVRYLIGGGRGGEGGWRETEWGREIGIAQVRCIQRREGVCIHVCVCVCINVRVHNDQHMYMYIIVHVCVCVRERDFLSLSCSSWVAGSSTEVVTAHNPSWQLSPVYWSAWRPWSRRTMVASSAGENMVQLICYYGLSLNG